MSLFFTLSEIMEDSKDNFNINSKEDLEKILPKTWAEFLCEQKKNFKFSRKSNNLNQIINLHAVGRDS